MFHCSYAGIGDYLLVNANLLTRALYAPNVSLCLIQFLIHTLVGLLFFFLVLLAHAHLMHGYRYNNASFVVVIRFVRYAKREIQTYIITVKPPKLFKGEKS